MNTHDKTNKMKKLAPMLFVMITVSLACISVAGETAFGYDFSSDSQGWRYMGLYDGGGLTPIKGFVNSENPWTDIDGDGGAILLGQEGFFPRSPTGNAWVHGDLNSPDLAYRLKFNSFSFSYDITGSHMDSAAAVYVQAVLVVRLPNENSDRMYRSDFQEVPLGADGAWDTHAYSGPLPIGTVIKKINLRVFFETGSQYWGWILVDNVVFN